MTALGRRELRPSTDVVVLVALGAALNLAGNYASTTAVLPVFLDTLGTCLVALVLGPWWGALTAAITTPLLVPISGVNNLPFLPVGVAAALVWGYGVRGFRLGRSSAGYLLLNLLVVLVVSVISTPIVLQVFGGATGHPSDAITAAISGLGPVGAVFVDNVLVNLVDKVLVGYVALAAVRALPPDRVRGAVLPGEGSGRVVAVVAGIAIVALVLVTYRIVGI